MSIPNNEIDRRYGDLPYPYKRFMDILSYKNGPIQYYRDYYLFCCEEAVKIHDTLRDQVVLEQAQSYTIEQMEKAVPTLSKDHTEHSMELARTMALVYRVNQEKLGNEEWITKNLLSL